MNKDTKNKILSLLSNNDTKQAIARLEEYGRKTANKQIVGTCALFSSRLNQLESDKISGAVSSENLRLATNGLTQNIIKYVTADTWEYHEKIEKRGIGRIKIKRISKRNNFFLLTSIVLALCLFYFYFIMEKPNPQQTIFVHGYEGRTHYVLENKGSLTFNVGSDTRTHIIGQNGRVIFGEVPDNFKGEKIEIGIKSDTFELKDKKKTYKFNGEPVYVEVKMKDEFLTFSARIKDKLTGIGIEKAKVVIEGRDPIYTDTDGRFKIIMDEKFFRPRHHFLIEKEGYRTKEDHYFAGVDMLNISLLPEKN